MRGIAQPLIPSTPRATSASSPLPAKTATAAARAASRTDWTANSASRPGRLWRHTRRKATATTAKLSRLTTWAKSVGMAASAHEEEGRDREECQHEGSAQELRHPEEAQLGDGGLEAGDQRRQREELDPQRHRPQRHGR